MKRVLAIAALLALVGAAVVYNLRAHTAPPQGASPASEPQTDSAAPITTAVARRGMLQRTITLIGVVRPDRQAAITSRVPSRISAILVHDGDLVRRGQALVTLDLGDAAAQLDAARAGIEAAEAQYRKAVIGKRARTVEMDTQIAQALGGLRTALAKQRQAELAVALTRDSASSDSERAAAGVRQAEAGLKQADIGLRQADDTVNRLRFLYSHGGVPKADLDGAEVQASIARAQMDAALAGLEEARAAAAPAASGVDLRKQVSEADVAAARAGVEQARRGLAGAYRAKAVGLRIADRDVEAARAQAAQAKAGSAQASAQVGSSVLASPLGGVVADLSAHPGEMAQPGIPLMTVVAPSPVRLEANVPARYASTIVGGLHARVSVDTHPDALHDGEVVKVLPVASSDSRTVPVWIRFTRAAAGLTPGATARAMVDLPPPAGAVSVPADAIRSEGNTSFVYVVVAWRAQRRNVQVGAIEGQLAQVLSGLRTDERVIVTAPAALESGARVREAGR